MALDFDVSDAVDYNNRRGEGPDERRIAQAIAAWQADHGLDIDGKLGPRTRASLDAASSATPAAASTVIDEIIAKEPGPAREAIVRRCHEGAEARIYYDLGAGGSPKRPAWPPWDEHMKCDCSAFADGALGFCRGAGGWNTGRTVADAVRFDRQARKILGPGPQTRYALLGYIRIPDLTEPMSAEVHAALVITIRECLKAIQPGDVIVHDGKYDPKTGVRKVPGHIGIAVAVHLDRFDPAHPERWYECVDVAHCSPHNSEAAGEAGHAIAVTNAAPWKHEAMFLLYKPLAAVGSGA